MFNIYKYINSEDVRNHLLSIDYNFTPAECAYIVGITKAVNFREKKIAYEELINTTQDCLVGSYSLHEFLRERMSDEEDPMKDIDRAESFECFFSALPLQFPLPFEKGDVVVDCTAPIRTPFVFSGEYADYWQAQNGAKLKGYIFGYNYEDFGAIMTNYHRGLDCERCRLKRKKYAFPQDEKEDVILLLLSAFQKGKIDEETFKEKYKHIALKVAEAELEDFFKG